MIFVCEDKAAQQAISLAHSKKFLSVYGLESVVRGSKRYASFHRSLTRNEEDMRTVVNKTVVTGSISPIKKDRAYYTLRNFR